MTNERDSSPLAPEVESVSRGSRFRLHLLAKMNIALIVLGIGPMLAFGVFTLAQQRESLSVGADHSMQATAEHISAQVDDWFDKNVRVLRAASNMPELTAMRREDQEKVLVAIKQAYPWMYLVFTLGMDGKNVARSDDQPLVDYSDRQYFKDVVNGDKALSWETVLGKTSGKPAVLIAVPLHANGRLVGVLAAAVTIEETSRMVANWKAGSTGFAFLVDEKSKVLAHPRSEFVAVLKRLVDHPMIKAFHSDSKPHLLAFVDEGRDTLGYVQGNRSGWAVVVEQSEDEVFDPLRATVTLEIVILVGTVLLVVAIGIAASRMLVRPIVAMTDSANHMSLGELDKSIVARGDDELSSLARSLERLRKSLRAAMSRL